MLRYRSIAGYVILLITLVVAAPLFAADSDTQYTLQAYAQAPGGQALLDGRYGDVIESVRSKPRSPSDEVTTQANLCVAYTMQKMTEKAQESCSAAIRKATNNRRRPWANSRTTKSVLAMMYSNRGVMHALAGYEVLAMKDLRKAGKLDSEANVYRQNLAAFETRPSTGSVGTARVANQ